MNPLMRKRVNKLQVFYGVVLFVSVNMVNEISDRNRTVMFTPYSTVSQFSISISDISFFG